MTAAPEPKSPRRTLLQAIAGIVIVAVFLAAAWYFTSPQFHRYVRGRVVAELENMTGGRVELGALNWNLRKLYLAGDNLTIHGLEGPDEIPYVRVNRIVVRLKILSFAGRRLGLRYVELDRPVIHLIVYPDGHTNQPTPRAAQNTKAQVQQIFNLQMDRAAIRQGVLLVNDRPIPLDLAADGVQAEMAHVSNAQRYDGSISAVKVRTAYRDFLPFDAAISAQFSLRNNQLDIQQLKLATGNSYVEAVGQAVHFNSPKLTLNYHGNLDLAQAGELARLPELRRGKLEVTGSGTYSDRNFSTTGKLVARGTEYRQANGRVVDLDGGADFIADNSDAALPHVFARGLGGTAVGSLEVKNWRTAEPAGALRLRLTALSVSRLAAAISSRTLPLDRLHPVGTAAGTLDATWRGSPWRATTDIALTAVPPASAAPDQLPVTANVHATYSAPAGMVRLHRLEFAGRSVALNASGTMADRTNHLEFALQVGNLRDLNMLLAPVSPSRQVPQEITGSGSFTGTLQGRLSAPEIAGQVALADFTVPVPLKLAAAPAHAKTAPPNAAPAQSAHFDSFSAEVRYSPSAAAITNAQLRRGGEQAGFSASAGLLKGSLAGSSPIAIRATVRNFQFSDLEGLAGYDYPLSGTVNASLEIAGTKDDPRGRGHVHMTGATIQGEPFQMIDADLLFANQEAQARHLVLAHNGGRVTGAAAYNLKTTAIRVNLQGTNFELAKFRQLQLPRMPVSGVLNFDARGSGTTEAPVIDADLHVRKLAMSGELLGGLDATAVTNRGVLRLTARSNFPVAHLEVDGTIGMHGDYPADLSLRMARLDVDPLLHDLLRGRLTAHSSATGTVLLKGPLRRPGLLEVNGDFSQFSAELEHMRIHNDGPLRFSMANQLLRLDQFRLAGDDTQLAIAGTVALAGTAQMDLRGEGHVNLKLLQSLNPDLHSSGTLDFAVNAGGTVARPSLRGQARVANGALSDITFPNGLSDIKGVLVFNQDRMHIQSLTASSGGGSVSFGGYITYGSGLGFNVSIISKGVRLRYPQGVSTQMNGDLRLTGTPGAATLSGQATVTRFSMSPQFDLALAIARSRQPVEPPNPASPLNNLRLNLHIVSTPELQVQSSLAKVTGDVDLNLRGTAPRPVLLGRINITEGQVNFNGTNYRVDRGDVTFSNPVRIEPVLDVEVTTRVQQYDITLGFHGPLDRLSTTYRSDPPLPTADIIALLAFGRTREESAMTTTAPNPSFTESASNAILGEALNTAFSNRIQRLFGGSRIKIAPEVAGAETNPNARVTIEQQVSKDFTVTYITDLSRSGQQIIQIEYNYSRKYSVIATRDQYGVLAFDIRIRQRRK